MTAAPSSATTQPPALALRHLAKTYPGVRALKDVALSLRAGEVHMLLGENGAGKSTLVKVLAGAVAADPGADLRIAGNPVRLKSPRHSRELGISVIHQELNLIPSLSAVQNMSLGRELRGRFGQLAHGAMRARAADALRRLGVEFDLDCPVERLSVAQQQLVEIAASLLDDCRVLILDEPTSALAQHEVDRLGEILVRLKNAGVAILYITHRFEEVFAFGARATVLRDGELIGERLFTQTDKAELIHMMVGRELREVFPARQGTLGPPLLEVAGVSSSGGLHDVSFSVRAGELVALAGLMGSGRTELARALFGLDDSAEGTLRVCGQSLGFGSVRQAVRAGLALVPEDRKAQGLVLGLSVTQNMTLAALATGRGRFGEIAASREASAVAALSAKLNIKAFSPSQAVGTLSGGNQQKVVLAKWLHTGAQVFLFDEPTRGIDVGAKQEIYRVLRELLERGAAILMISSELPEVLGMADRILVMCEGRISGELDRERATPAAILELATAFRRPSPEAKSA